KAKPLDGPWFLDEINDATSIQRPKPKEPGDHRHDLAHFDRGPGRPGFDPAQVELRPALQSSLGGCKDSFSLSELDTSMIHDDSRRRSRGGSSHGRVAEIELPLRSQEISNRGPSRPGE